MKQILMDQFLPSGCGFRVVSVVDGVGNLFTKPGTGVPSAKDEIKNFEMLRKWCKQNCSGVWGYSTNDLPIYDNKTYEIHYRRYFAFVDEEDILAVALYMGLEVVSIKSMWPSNTKFMIFYQDDAK